MWKNQKVSVAFSTYNEKDSIRKCIEECFKTGYVDEVIAVDNNAAKGTKEEILKTKAKYFLEEKQGPLVDQTLFQPPLPPVQGLLRLKNGQRNRSFE